MSVALPGGADFALCLTHDVDRPYKTYQALYFALREQSLYHLRTLFSNERPYWQFDEVTQLERELGVRSAFYFLNEPSQMVVRPLRELFSMQHLTDHLGRYDIETEEIRDVVRQLDRDGWEIGLHGSSTSHRNEERLRTEKETLEEILGHSVTGVRQHYLSLDVPETWRRQADVGLQYDTSLGSSSTYGFDHGYLPRRPFDDEFVVFPLTLMETALPDPSTDFDEAWSECEQLLDEAAENGAVMTVLWHPRFFNEREFPGYKSLYRRLVKSALDRGGWVGAPGHLYEKLTKSTDSSMQSTGR